MESQFEQKPSVEFEKKPHHILRARDVVFALQGFHEELAHGEMGDAEYIEWVHDVLTQADAFGQNSVYEDARTLENIASRGQDDIYKIQAPKILEVAQDMKQAYESNIQQTTGELNAFLSKNPGLFLWTTEPNDTIDEIIIETQQDGSLRPVVKASNICIDINRMSETYREFIINDLYE